jgi:hypothetical protein
VCPWQLGVAISPILIRASRRLALVPVRYVSRDLGSVVGVEGLAQALEREGLA